MVLHGSQPCLSQSDIQEEGLAQLAAILGAPRTDRISWEVIDRIIVATAHKKSIPDRELMLVSLCYVKDWFAPNNRRLINKRSLTSMTGAAKKLQRLLSHPEVSQVLCDTACLCGASEDINIFYNLPENLRKLQQLLADFSATKQKLAAPPQFFTLQFTSLFGVRTEIGKNDLIRGPLASIYERNYLDTARFSRPKPGSKSKAPCGPFVRFTQSCFRELGLDDPSAPLKGERIALALRMGKLG